MLMDKLYANRLCAMECIEIITQAFGKIALIIPTHVVIFTSPPYIPTERQIRRYQIC